MTAVSAATLPRLSASQLSSLLLAQSSGTANLDAPAPASTIAVVDVRDDDHVGGHIRNSIHAPSSALDYTIPALVRKLRDKETVVFHCALSQQRGPSAALRYVRERQRLLNLPARLEGGSGAGEVVEKDREGKVGEGVEGEGKEAEGGKEQKVYVLDRGFVGWQERFGEDARLTEGYRKEIWKDGY